MKLNLVLFSILFLLFFTSGFSQNHPDIKTRDVIYMKDGRVLKGEIVQIEESGKITFAAKNGNTIEIQRIEYEYYIENERLNVKFSDTLVVNTRKSNAFEFSFGLSTIVFEMKGFTDQDYGGYKPGSPWYNPTSVRVAGGRYFGLKHYVGLRLDYGLGGLDEYLSPALKYKFQLDGYRSNHVWYVTLEGKYEYIKDNFLGLEEHINPYGDVKYDWQHLQQTFNTFGIVVGPGYGYTFKNKRSISIEATYFKNLVLSNAFTNSPNGILLERWNSAGIGLAVTYNL